MGRTLATFTQLIEQEAASWRAFRRALRREDQRVLDTLFQAAKLHMSAGSYASKASPFEAMLVAMLIEASKKTSRLEQRILRLEQEQPAEQKETEEPDRDKEKAVETDAHTNDHGMAL